MKVQWAILPNINLSAEAHMYKIKEAKLVRMTERNDVPCAHVEVEVEGMNDSMLVEFTRSKDNSLDMTHVYRKQASRELDWYDNNLHQAFHDVSSKLFQQNGQLTDLGEREEFKQQVLAFGELEKEMLQHF
jgi:hypothetical protein